MRYHQVSRDEGIHLVAERENRFFDLTTAKRELGGFVDLARTASIAGGSVDAVASGLLDDADELDADDVAVEQRRPVVPDEVWAAGVTYEISEQAREEESGMPDMYLNVYEAERPEVFFKATPSRTVGPRENVGVREDSEWNVPEPELGVVLYEGDIVGYTIGNDVSSRDIEGANPLYLPQAKVYERCCSIGPCVASSDVVHDPEALEISMTIERDGETVFSGRTSTSEMVRSCEELVDYYTRHNAVPEVAVLLTGTSLVPDDDFNLTPEDTITIDIENIGTLTNGVTDV